MSRILKKLILLSNTQEGWLGALFIPVFALSVASYVQFGLGYKPCFYCINERLVFVGLGVVAFLGLFLSTVPLFVDILIAGWVGISFYGVVLVVQHINITLHPSMFEQCLMFIKYPDYAPLDKLFPSFFTVQADCADNIIRFGGLMLAQWLAFVFLISMIVSVIVFAGNICKRKKDNNI